MPQLDGLRAIAALAVVYYHWSAPAVPVGKWGVQLFLVLSGYLITGILLDLRHSHLSPGAAARAFFARRVMRLCPAYALCLAIAFAFVPHARAHWAWFVSYTSNILQATSPDYFMMTPTWTLALEQQFYLVWFGVVMLAGCAWLRRGILPILLVCALYRGVVCALGEPMLVFLPFANADALLLGAWLRVARDGAAEAPGWGGAAALAMLALGALLTWRLTPEHWLAAALVPLGIGLVSVWAVARGRRGFDGTLGRILGHPAVVYLGRISYGIYLYHMLLELFSTQRVTFLWRFGTRDGGWDGLIGHTLLAIGFAALSYHLLERPLLEWQRRGYPLPWRRPPALIPAE